MSSNTRLDVVVHGCDIVFDRKTFDVEIAAESVACGSGC